MRLFRKPKRAAVYAVVRGIIWLFNVVPRRVAVYVGGWLGLAVWKLSPRDQHRTVRHLSLAFGDALSHREKLNVGRAFFVNSGKNAADVLRVKKRFASEIRPLIECVGMEHFDRAYRRGQGLIGVTGHIGNFELLAGYVSTSGYQVAVIGRELYDPRLDHLLLENREAVGLTNIATTDSPKRIIKWLRDGNVIGVLIDTDSHRVRGEFVPAFGRWSYTPVGQTLLGLKTGAAFVPMVCLRTSDNRYRVVIEPEVKYDPEADPDSNVIRITSLCTRALERIIRANLDQWPWQHNRWRTKRTPELDRRLN